MAKFTVKEQRFIDFYEGNATDAARQAGYKNPEISGKQNIRKHTIAEEIQKREEKMKRPKIATREQRQEFWSKVMDDPNEDMKNRLRAAELLGKSEADFLDRIRDESGPKKIILKRQDEE